MTEEEYKKLWEEKAEGTQTEYNACRFAEDKVQYIKEWLNANALSQINFDTPQNIVDIIAKQKIRIATDEQYKKLCQSWSDKIEVYKHLNKDKELISIELPYIFKSKKEFNIDIWNLIWRLTSKDELIIKCNHGSGWNCVITRDMNPTRVIERMNEWLSLNYAYIGGYEAQYENIKPGFIVQPLMIHHPSDYGFWCVNGKIEGISVTKKLAKNIEEYFAFVDENGKKTDWYIGNKTEQDDLSPSQKNRIAQMIPYVKKLAKGFDFVRVDMYYINDKVYFGEMTFTPCSGILSLTKNENNEE